MPDNKVLQIYAGLNTMNGYINLLEKELSSANTIFILKGSPGSGKSTILKQLLSMAKQAGEPYTVIKCSADPDSLDAVILNNLKVAVADGTSPHVLEPKTVGIRERIINLGECWDNIKLKKYTDEINDYNEKKLAANSNAYNLIRAYGEVEKVRDSLVKKAIDYNKIKSYAKTFFGKHLNKTKNSDVKIAQTEVFCYKGFDNTNSFYSAKNTVLLRDKYNISSIFLNELYILGKQKKVEMNIAVSPIDSGKLIAIYFPNSDLYIKSDKFTPFEGNKTISSDRFINKAAVAEEKEKLMFYKKILKTLIEEARISFTEARKNHLAMEEIYLKTIDFKKIDEKAKAMYTEIFSS
ncbi:hypothetical protein LJB90_01180 [Eubacteriales bacterium OttesenSCG-928-G02]|nr:hypothetical protein [Eubacteriales bacterium OttesenSCG-928-G02]